MKTKPLPLTHLAAIAAVLFAMAAAAYWYSTSSDSVAGIPERSSDAETETPSAPETKEACEAAGGAWNECASPCPPDVICIQVCVARCEGIDDGKKAVDVYYPNSTLDPEHLDCSSVFPVRRAVEKGDRELVASIEALLRGPTDAEREAGYFSSLPEGVSLQGLAFEGGVVRVDLSKELAKVAGACRVTSIRSQIEKTLLGRPGVKGVIISVDGEIEEALQP